MACTASHGKPYLIWAAPARLDSWQSRMCFLSHAWIIWRTCIRSMRNEIGSQLFQCQRRGRYKLVSSKLMRFFE